MVAFWSYFLQPKILVYADFMDPFCYIGFHIVYHQARSEGIFLEWRGMELNPDTPADGYTLETGGNSDLRPGMWASVQHLAEQSGLRFSEPQHVPNTRLAHALVQGAPRDVKNPLIERIYQAYFNSQKDIGNPEVLMEAGESLNLPMKEMQTILSETKNTQAVMQHREEAREYGFAGMPGFVYKRKTYFGALSQDAWKKILS